MDLAPIERAEIYGGWAASLLERIQKPVAGLSEQFIANFYELLSNAEHNRKLLERLSSAEYAQLQKRQAQHLMLLISPGLTRSFHRQEAERAGRAHALVGVDIQWLIETYGLYQQKLFELLEDLVPGVEDRERLIRILSRRILLDIEGQVHSFERIDRDMSEAFLRVDRKVLAAANLADLVRDAMAAIGGLEGEVCLFLARADAHGILQIEASFGAAAERYHRAMEDGIIPKISIDSSQPAGQGIGGRAWRSGQIEVSDAWLRDERAAPWASLGRELGFRSGAAVPLLDEAGNSIAVLSMYSLWPGFFSILRVQNFLIHIQRVLGYAMQRLSRAPVIPMLEQQEYRQLLEESRVTMLYQPIIDLRDGRLCRLEALARLQSRSGALLSPARFLPVFGESELLQLFEHGLRQICAGSRELEARGLNLPISINLPAEGLGDERYEEAIQRILEEESFAPDRLQLEVLESEDGPAQTEQKQLFIQRLRELGVRFAQDDLGSGHSSLLRMGQYNFDEVKIDQGLVRSVLHRPQRALEFILYLTRLAHAFHTQVVVEGLENLGMLEAAAILGADHGQGYGIARPMPAADVAAWWESYCYPVDAQNPQTALGAMAGYLLWEMQMAVMADCAGAAEHLPSAHQVVERFLSAHALEESPLGHFLRETVARGNSPTEARVNRQTKVIEHLTEYWLKEMSR
jgi:EAL domain-containing protein (putative c-di-GMP-specific phosphodiesterase class I)